MMSWPSSLITEMAHRRCVVFVGAGLSRNVAPGSPIPPDWKKLLEELARESPDSFRIKPLVTEMLAKDRYLDAAEVVQNSYEARAFADKIRSAFGGFRYKGGEVHQAVLELDQKVVVTTNFDEIYENYVRDNSEGEGHLQVLKYFDSGLSDSLKSNVRLVLKAHGCVTAPDRIILTRSEFFEAKMHNPEFIRVLSALAVTHTFVFLGCSIVSDPNVQLFLENGFFSAPGRYKHFALIDEPEDPSIAEAVSKSYNLELVTFPTGQYEKATELILELASQVTAHRTERNMP